MGIDIGSTTLKIIIAESTGSIIREVYKRHGAEVDRVLTGELNAIARAFPGERFVVCLTGSAGMGIAERVGLPFIQEVVTSIAVARARHPGARVLLDLGARTPRSFSWTTTRDRTSA
jgi:activator of 2-hydroxyglutaryl-CoA dehydratase